MAKKEMEQIRIELMNSEYKREKEKRLKELREKVIEKQPKTAAEYFAIANSVFGKNRIKSRQRINEIIFSRNKR